MFIAVAWLYLVASTIAKGFLIALNTDSPLLLWVATIWNLMDAAILMGAMRMRTKRRYFLGVMGGCIYFLIPTMMIVRGIGKWDNIGMWSTWEGLTYWITIASITGFAWLLRRSTIPRLVLLAITAAVTGLVCIIGGILALWEPFLVAGLILAGCAIAVLNSVEQKKYRWDDRDEL